MELKDLIRSIPDFPEPGIMFRDITTALKDPQGLQLAVNSMADALEGVEFDMSSYTQNGITYNNYKLFLMSYLDF